VRASVQAKNLWGGTGIGKGRERAEDPPITKHANSWFFRPGPVLNLYEPNREDTLGKGQERSWGRVINVIADRDKKSLKESGAGGG